jgi:hypothetical protein
LNQAKHLRGHVVDVLYLRRPPAAALHRPRAKPEAMVKLPLGRHEVPSYRRTVFLYAARNTAHLSLIPFQPRRQDMNKTRIFLAAAVAAMALPAMAQSTLTVVNFGGANGAAQKKAYVEPFEKSGAGKIVSVEYNGEQAKIKAMVEARKVVWDVVEVESPTSPAAATKACSRSSTGPRWATRPTTSRRPCTSAASAPSCGPRCWRTTPTS